MKLRSKIEEFISQGNFDMAFKELQNIELSNNELKTEIIALSSRYNKWQKDYHGGVTENQIELNKIIRSLIFTTGRIEGLQHKNNTSNRDERLLKLALFVLATLLLTSSLICYYFYHKNRLLKSKINQI